MTEPLTEDDDAFRAGVETRFAEAGRDRQEVVRIYNEHYEGMKLSQSQARIVSAAFGDALRRCGALVP